MGAVVYVVHGANVSFLRPVVQLSHSNSVMKSEPVFTTDGQATQTSP